MPHSIPPVPYPRPTDSLPRILVQLIDTQLAMYSVPSPTLDIAGNDESIYPSINVLPSSTLRVGLFMH